MRGIIINNYNFGVGGGTADVDSLVQRGSSLNGRFAYGTELYVDALRHLVA